ncbi:TetR/AcrR family transcriptional regulator [Cnuibacter sp. UC19_7]|uniref:TetR/AcrR family transcriptional regulator n=1 Tax=Cnuibacter sp. UC19_7 TaxID=3350166 RepID=UPI0036706BC8
MSEYAEHEVQRRARLRAPEVRQRVLDVALDRVGSLGMTVGFEHLMMDDLIREAEVSRSSTYRLWDSKEAFVADLMVEIARRAATSLVDESTLQICVRILLENVDRVATPEGRHQVVLETIRVALQHNYQSVVSSVAWQSYVSLTAALLGRVDNSAREEITEALRSGSDAFVEQMAAFHQWFAELLGYRIRPEWAGDYRPYATLVSAIVEGLGIRQIANPSIVLATYRGPATMQPDPEWTLASAGLLGVFERFMEPDPEFDLAKTLAEIDALRASAD